ncbi:hypothetical protein ODJ79_43135 [Actinoplanes sp. KI2]|uniref:hypothetical protein n=1 Tax=Actinoplanes sp. KI2 TaxID=2983315 RepID=UPI0021D5E0C3|nr:hypothetical protein [Actinoplanes sp. KI2]MCU7730552.1 hypothetical protein [Actinoplanes sp. KI2]
MRRFAPLLILPLLTAGCSAADGDATAGGPTPNAAGSAAARASVDPSVAAAGDKALSGNTKAICAQAERTTTSFGQAFLADLQMQIDARGKGGAAEALAQQKIDQDVSSFSSALAGMGSLADNKALKSALTQMSKQVKAFKGDVSKINAEKMAGLTATLDKACGRS